MSDRLLSVGLDVGTTSTQLILSELLVENRAGSFSVPEMEIAQRRILYKSPVHFTPLISGELVDAAALRKIVEAEYAAAGIRREDVDTGAIIITGETSRKENARAVLQELSGFAGDFVVAAAGPHLESVLAAKGAGAVEFSRKTGKNVLHMDIGGGTSNLAWIREGTVVETGCLNVGGRLIKVEKTGEIRYISPVLQGLTELKTGEIPDPERLRLLADTLVSALEMAAGLREKTELLEKLTTKESVQSNQNHMMGKGDGSKWVLSFSGGVADCIDTRRAPFAFGDIGPVLGQAIRESRLCAKEYMLGSETIRATVIGAGCHSAQLSGSTVYVRNVALPLQNLPVVRLPEELQESAELTEWLRKTLARQEGPAVLALRGFASPSYAQVTRLARAIADGAGAGNILICLEQDMAKALGQALAARLGSSAGVLCIDRVKLPEESYLDVGAPVGPALPVVVKTLVLER